MSNLVKSLSYNSITRSLQALLGGGKQVNIDTAMPTSVYAYRSGASQNIRNGTGPGGAYVSATGVLLDKMGEFSSDTFTAKRHGLYSLQAMVVLGYSTNSSALDGTLVGVHVNGSLYGGYTYANFVKSLNTQRPNPISAELELKPGDTVKILAYANVAGGDSVVLNCEYFQFSMKSTRILE